jgi:hypothetical protein
VQAPAQRFSVWEFVRDYVVIFLRLWFISNEGGLKDEKGGRGILDRSDARYRAGLAGVNNSIQHSTRAMGPR